MDDTESDSDSLLESIPNEMIGQTVKSVLAGDTLKLQNKGRIILRRFFTRNSIFTAKVQQDERINIPQAEAEKLNLQKGDSVQVFLSPLDRRDDDMYECPDCNDAFAERTGLLSHECPEIGQKWGEV